MRSAKPGNHLKGNQAVGKNMINFYSCILNIGKCVALEHAKYELICNPFLHNSSCNDCRIKTCRVADKAQVYY